MKRISSILFVLLLMLVSFTVGTQYPRGDVDYNGKVNIADVVTLIDYLLTGTWEGDPIQTETFNVNGVIFKMATIEGGSFMMGASESDSEAGADEKPAHQVTLSSYSIGITEVTQALWLAVMGSNPSTFTSDNGYTDNLQRPVENVSWNDCQTFITKLNELTGRQFRMPTEAEWEYAARGGNLSQGYKYSGSNTIGDVAWYYENSYALGHDSPDYGTHNVAMKAPNELGIYDMSGNVSEWCQDWYDPSYYSSSPLMNPTGPASDCYGRVFRGCSWGTFYRYCRVLFRNCYSPTDKDSMHGLRLAM